MTIENILNYFSLLKEADEEKIPNYKLEMARFLYNSEYFIFKIKLILSIIGMVGSLLLIINLFWNYLLHGYYFYEFRFMFYLILYASTLVFALSFITYKKRINELKSIRNMIEE